MAVSDWSTTAASNTAIDGINIDENCLPGNLNDSDRAIMANVAKAIGTYNMGTLNPGATDGIDISKTMVSADSTTQFYSWVNRCYMNGANSADFLRTNYFGSHYQATAGTLNNLQGTHQYIWHAGLGGTVTNAEVSTAHCRVDGGSITNEVDLFRAASSTLGVSASIQRIVGFSVGDIGDATKVQEAFAVDIPDLRAVSVSIGVRSSQTAASNRFFIAGLGGAQSVHLGWFSIGKTAAPTQALDVVGNIFATGEITSTALRIGYSAGAGQIVTQLTSKTTTTAINKVSGQIITNNAALASNAVATFTVTNTTIAASDVVIVNIQSGAATPGTYQAWVSNITTGSFGVNLRNISAGSLSEALTLNFAIIKAANS